jgi:hypothetical protein
MKWITNLFRKAPVLQDPNVADAIENALKRFCAERDKACNLFDDDRQEAIDWLYSEYGIISEGVFHKAVYGIAIHRIKYSSHECDEKLTMFKLMYG